MEDSLQDEPSLSDGAPGGRARDPERPVRLFRVGAAGRLAFPGVVPERPDRLRDPGSFRPEQLPLATRKVLVLRRLDVSAQEVQIVEHRTAPQRGQFRHGVRDILQDPLKEKSPFGVHGGVTVSLSDKASLGAEVRLVNQTAFSVSLGYAF